MNEKALFLAEKLCSSRTLTVEEYEQLISLRDAELADLLAKKADEARKRIYGRDVYIRGLIEISSYCKNDCLYCGIRRSNREAERYRLTPAEIFACCEEGYRLGFRTFVLQGGEDVYFSDEMLCGLIARIKSNFPDCAVTLSLGEREYASFKRLFDSGADRYLLRHETADRPHYEKLHPQSMSFENRMKCLHDLRGIGYQVGAGFMVGSPYQTDRSLAMDLKFIEEFKPDMCGIGPFVPHHCTPFKDMSGGSAELTCFLLSVIRLIRPNILLPSTTALGTIDPLGREKGLKAGANVIMPNLSPKGVRGKYLLYDGKICTGEEAAQCIECLKMRVKSAGFEIVTDRGDIKKQGDF